MKNEVLPFTHQLVFSHDVLNKKRWIKDRVFYLPLRRNLVVWSGRVRSVMNNVQTTLGFISNDRLIIYIRLTEKVVTIKSLLLVQNFINYKPRFNNVTLTHLNVVLRCCEPHFSLIL